MNAEEVTEVIPDDPIRIAQSAVDRAIDAMRTTGRLFHLSDNHVLMQACKALVDAADVSTGRKE